MRRGQPGRTAPARPKGRGGSNRRLRPRRAGRRHTGSRRDVLASGGESEGSGSADVQPLGDQVGGATAGEDGPGGERPRSSGKRARPRAAGGTVHRGKV